MLLSSMPWRDHPRIRGEHSIVSGATCTISGSSPHTRGARGGGRRSVGGRGIIPAYAGSTSLRNLIFLVCKDHPRIRGEHVVTENDSSLPSGSSPHTRGAPVTTRGLTRSRGIIPAYAGSTEERATDRLSNPDHPRIRGEHKSLEEALGGTAGSSPHTRGALRRGQHHHGE